VLLISVSQVPEQNFPSGPPSPSNILIRPEEKISSSCQTKRKVDTDDPI